MLVELNLLTDLWNNLKNQVTGRGALMRSDIDSGIQNKIINDYNLFHNWSTNLGIGQRITVSYNDELNHFKQLLEYDTKMFIDWLKVNKPGELPPTGYVAETKDGINFTYLIGSVGAGILIGILLKKLL